MFRTLWNADTALDKNPPAAKWHNGRNSRAGLVSISDREVAQLLYGTAKPNRSMVRSKLGACLFEPVIARITCTGKWCRIVAQKVFVSANILRVDEGIAYARVTPGRLIDPIRPVFSTLHLASNNSSAKTEAAHALFSCSCWLLPGNLRQTAWWSIASPNFRTDRAGVSA